MSRTAPGKRVSPRHIKPVVYCLLIIAGLKLQLVTGRKTENFLVIFQYVTQIQLA